MRLGEGEWERELVRVCVCEGGGLCVHGERDWLTGYTNTAVQQRAVEK